MGRYKWLLLILLAATFLRLHAITEVPPGFTHDEADHGVDAWGVVNGTRPVYFTVGYGREPLFDYSTAVLMSFLGPTYLAGRLTAVMFSLVLLVGMYAWTKLAFDERTALFTAAGLAVSFWPVMTGRHALRTVTLPALFVLALYFYWRSVFGRSDRGRWGWLPAGLLLGLTLYTYIPARGLWLLPVIMLGHIAVIQRHKLPLAVRQTLPILLLAGLVAWPLFAYLQANPTAEVRIEQLALPLTEARAGNFAPLLDNVISGLASLFIEGDSAWRYNIAGRPFLPPIMAVLFVGGAGVCLWHIRKPPAFFALVWFAAGLAPILITGAELSGTQAIGLQPVLYLFPALALSKLVSQAQTFQVSETWKVSPAILASLLFVFLFANTFQRYFHDWATRPEVRLEYETSLVTAIEAINENNITSVAISSNAPGRFHDPATAQMTLTNPNTQPRWFNGNTSLLLPQSNTTSWLVFTGLAGLHPALTPYLIPQTTTTLPLAETDVDNPVTIHTLDGTTAWQTIYPQFQDPTHSLSTETSTFGDAVILVGYDLQQNGETAQLITIWQIAQPIEAETVLFTHIIGSDGIPVAQLDRLDVPSYFWQAGDIFLQLHEIPLDTLPAGTYPVAIGFYTQADEVRLPVVVDGIPAGDIYPLTTLILD